MSTTTTKKFTLTLLHQGRHSITFRVSPHPPPTAPSTSDISPQQSQNNNNNNNNNNNGHCCLILKTLISRYTDQRNIDRFRKEFELGYKFRNSEHIVSYLSYYDTYMDGDRHHCHHRHHRQQQAALSPKSQLLQQQQGFYHNGSGGGDRTDDNDNEDGDDMTTTTTTLTTTKTTLPTTTVIECSGGSDETMMMSFESSSSSISLSSLSSSSGSNNNRSDDDDDGDKVDTTMMKESVTLAEEVHSGDGDNAAAASAVVVPNACFWLNQCNLLLNRYHLQASAIIIMEDFGGESLLNMIPPNIGLSVPQFLSIAIQVAKILNEMHRKNIIHRDIKPDNICINRVTNQVKMIDFGSATELREVNMRGERVEGTLAYISPEQTGRMNRNVDYRSDFYMTGCTFYQMLLGKLPFTAVEVRDLVYCHMAVEPIAPVDESFTVPPVLSDIIMKLLNKSAEDRYQSSAGLLMDLQKCKQLWDDLHEIPSFEIAVNDISEKFIVTNKIYGRSREIALLKDAYESSRWNNKVEVLTISGYSGIGKTTLVREVEKFASLTRGFYISSKFDQYNKTNAHGAIADAFRVLVKRILTKPENIIAEYRKSLEEALGVNGQVIVNIIPELQKLIGPQKPLDDIGPVEARNRFKMVFQDFVSVFTKKNYLVMFLDDLQWADVASIRLLQVLLQSPDIKNLLFIGAYRSNELTNSCPAMIALEEMKKDGIPVKEIELKELSFDDVHQWISDTLSLTLEKSKELTDFIYSRCDGNPFFVKQLLQVLYDKHLIYYNGSQWEYKISGLHFPAADNVVNLMIHQLDQFSDKTKQLLQLGSCLGNSFPLAKLELLSGKSSNSLNEDLYPALNNGLIHVVGEIFSFAHDRVQEASYSRISPDERRHIHLHFARLLYQRAGDVLKVADDAVCEIADHYNQGKSEITNREEIIILAKLNLRAGQVAKTGAAYVAAIEYFSSGIEAFLYQSQFCDIWSCHYDLGFHLYKELAEVYYLSSQYQKSDETLDVLLEHVQKDCERVELYNIRAVQLQVLGHFKEAIDVGRMALNIIGIDLPAEPENIQKVIAIDDQIVTQILQNEYGNGKLLSNYIQYQSKEEDSKYNISTRILMNVLSACYLSDPLMFQFVVTKSVRQSLEAGWIIDTPIGFAYYGAHLIDSGKPELGYEFGKLAISLCELGGNSTMKCQVYNVVGTMIIPWFNHVRRCEYYMNIGYKYGLECGELQYAGYGRSALNTVYHIRGEPINNIIAETDKMLVTLRRIANQMALDSVRTNRLMMYHLMGRRFKNHANIEQMFEKNDKHLSETNARYAEAHWKINKAILYYIYDTDIEKAFELITDVSENYLRYMPSLPTRILHYLYETLITFKVLHKIDSIPHLNRNELMQRIEKNEALIRGWATHCPENFSNKLLLIEAEKKRLEGDWSALDLYDKSIEVAHIQGFTSEGAIAHELAGVLLLKKNKPHLAKYYLDQACKIFDTWGASRKVDRMLVVHRGLFNGDPIRSESYHSSGSTSSLSLALLDVETVIRANHVLSSTIDMKQLLLNIMKIIMETSGGETGALIIDDIVEAYYEHEGSVPQIRTLCNIPVSQWTHGCRAIIEYVTRTRETVILHNASVDGRQFKYQPYIEERKCKSILCMPIVRQDELKGLLYLENNLMCDAFTEQRQQILSFVVSQMAISLENARFFKAQMDAAEKIAEIQRKRVLESEIYQRKQEDFIDRICHEIRNPLSGIFGNLDMMSTVVKSMEKRSSGNNEERNELEQLKECIESINRK